MILKRNVLYLWVLKRCIPTLYEILITYYISWEIFDYFVFRSDILKEVTERSISNIPIRKNLIVLGDRECGKTTLIARFQGTEDPKIGVGLEYQYVDIKDDKRDGNKFWEYCTLYMYMYIHVHEKLFLIASM